jgi:hypothetical protein
MKTLLMLILCPFLSYSQSFMLKMNIVEEYQDRIIFHDSTKVLLIINERNIGLTWKGKSLHFTRENFIPNKEKRKQIQKAKDRYNNDLILLTKDDYYFKIRALYLDDQRNVYYICLHMQEGVLLWITRLDEMHPFFFFQTVL